MSRALSYILFRSFEKISLHVFFVRVIHFFVNFSSLHELKATTQTAKSFNVERKYSIDL